jgi:hypothetical protein
MVQIHLEVSEERLEELDKLMEAVDLHTRKELFNNALTLLEWAVNERKPGG